MLSISSLTIYPVKSLAGISLHSAALTNQGLEFDRQWMVVDKSGHFVSQRELPSMALIKTALTADKLQLSRADLGSVEIDLNHQGREDCTVKVWLDYCQAYDQGEQAADFLAAALDLPLRLVRMKEDFRRPVDSKYALSDDNIVGFADGFPLLVISEESLEQLNEKLEYPLAMNRFRPNITVCGGEPFAEDNWEQLSIGPENVRIALRKPCARCPITTVDQETGETSKEPLCTLSFFRKQNGKVMFGQNAVVIQTGTINCGDRVQVLSL